MPNKCQLCFEKGTTHNRLNRHHVRGRKFPDIMWTHTNTCHWFAQWITNSFVELGIESSLTASFITFAYQRTITQREQVVPRSISPLPGDFIFPIVEGKK